MPTTARSHFDEDISRARQIVLRALDLERAGEPERLFQDIRLSGLAAAVGAMDAYLCDKYVDCLAAVLRAYSRGQWRGKLPAVYAKERLPAGEVLNTTRQHRPGWGIRMAARHIMERDNMLSLSRLEEMFNPILPAGSKLWSDFIPVLLAQGYKRLTGPLTQTDIAALRGTERQKATKKAINTVKTRLTSIIQMRHDWIHNLGRPKNAITVLTHGEALVRLEEVCRFITSFDDHIETHRLA